MSSTNRSQARSFHISDYYVTPISAITRFLENCPEEIFEGKKILDPCAGGDHCHEMSYPAAIQDYYDGVTVDTADIREDSLATIKCDYLQMECKNLYDVIITNPPFSIAEDVIRKAYSDVKDDGWVIMLLRLNYFGSDKRELFWKEFPPKYAFVHRKRISFTDDKKTDSIEYMHCLWHKGESPKFCMLKLI